MKPGDQQDISNGYQRLLPTFEQLRVEAVHEIEHALAKNNVKVHAVSSRLKSVDSLISKAERQKLSEPLSNCSDIVGVRIVALFLSDLDRIAALLSETFDVVSTDNKLQTTKPYEFGYLSIHLIAKFKAIFVGTRYDSIKSVAFEIQIRTIAMDAWAAASHYLDYKSEVDVPEELRRDFHALSGLFYVADQHFEMFFRTRDQARRRVESQLTSGTNALDQPINLDTLDAYLAMKYPDRTPSEPNDNSSIVKALMGAGIVTLGELDRYLEKGESRFLDYERKHPPGGPGKRFARVGVVRVTFRNDAAFNKNDSEQIRDET